MSQTISRGECGYRTGAMEPAAARAFARCLSANETRFTNVELLPSKQARTPKLFVRFQPANQDRLEAIAQDQQEARAERAMNEPFLFWADPDHRHLTWCYSVASGETYSVTSADCSCPDFHYRAGPAGLKCKHMIAASVWRADRRAERIAGEPQ